MGLAVNEQETTITYARDGTTATVWTSDTTVMTKLDKMAKESSDWKLIKEEKINGDIVAKRYEVAKELISYRTKKVNRTMTDEQRRQAAERLALSRSKSN